MRLFVGLGNPGAKYERTRHNAGYMAIDRIAKDHGFGPWRSKFKGAVSEGRLGAEKVCLLKPETGMNLSGASVAAAAGFYKIAPADVVVFHDELDLAPGKCRIKAGGGHAGHNGLRSLHAQIGPDYARVRIGIGHPGHRDRVHSYVLHDFAKADRNWLEDVLRGISDGAVALAAGNNDGFMNAVARCAAPQRPSTGTAAAAGGKLKPAKPDSAKNKKPSSAQSALQMLIDRFR